MLGEAITQFLGQVVPLVVHYGLGRKPGDGRVIEELGWYDPNAKEPDKQVSLNRERIEHWLSHGAQPSDTVRQLLTQQGIALKA